MFVFKNDFWDVGDGWCKIYRFFFNVFYNVVIISLIIVSIERYYVICKFIWFKKCFDFNVCNWKFIFGVWVVVCFLVLL